MYFVFWYYLGRKNHENLVPCVHNCTRSGFHHACMQLMMPRSRFPPVGYPVYTLDIQWAHREGSLSTGYTTLCTIRLTLLGLLSHPLQIKDSKLTLMSYNFARGSVLSRTMIFCGRFVVLGNVLWNSCTRVQLYRTLRNTIMYYTAVDQS
jgi:hypothetical protein